MVIFVTMITLALPVLTLAAATLLAGGALVMAFFKRMPAVALSYIAMLVAAGSGMVAFVASTLWFWAAATAIALAIEYLADDTVGRGHRCYIAGGALAGALVGLVIGSKAAVIVAAAAGAFLGYEAYRRTPAGRDIDAPWQAAGTFAAVALPVVVNFSITMLIFSQLLLLR